ncbi:MAG: CDF family Co(II)/Ni(II) efflux transporter DmeF [Magnetococcus sp. WYHC-3]
MHTQTLSLLAHSHEFHTEAHQARRRTAWVILVTAAMMAGEIIAGHVFGSMALLADGWHMATHVAALGITLLAYRFARIHARDPAFTFGTGKVNSLGGFGSAVALIMAALFMGVESLGRLLHPETIHYEEALLVAVLGLGVNMVSAVLLHGGHDHVHDDHDHDHDHSHDQHHDHNLRAAYLHVLADAVTSLLAIVALFMGRQWGWVWMDALMGVVGAGVITVWGWGLLRQSGAVLLDASVDARLCRQVRERIEADSDNRVADLHLWRVGPSHHAAIISLVSHDPQDPAYYKGLLRGMEPLAHVTVEVNRCPGERCGV